MKVYRGHHCLRAHRTFRTFAECAFVWVTRKGTHLHPLWVLGEGRFASVSRCRHAGQSGNQTTVQLHETADEALASKRIIDEYGCGGGCSKNHEVVELALPT